MQEAIARADALRLRSEVEMDPALAAEAIAILRSVPLSYRNAAAVPLCGAVRALGALTDDLDVMETAVGLAREAIGAAPGPRAHAALAAALTVLGERAADPDQLAEAAVVYEVAGAGFAAAGAAIDEIRMQRNRGAVLTLLAVTADDPNALAQAAASLRAARAMFAAREAPLDAALAAENLCHTLRLLGERTRDPALLAEAVAAGRAALAAVSTETPSGQRVTTETNLANALASLGGADFRNEALDLYRAALARLQGPKAVAQRAAVRHNLWLAEQAAPGP
jgi:hypothetical protein